MSLEERVDVGGDQSAARQVCELPVVSGEIVARLDRLHANPLSPVARSSRRECSAKASIPIELNPCPQPSCRRPLELAREKAEPARASRGQRAEAGAALDVSHATGMRL